ncbi:MAG: hypothetical protein JNK05_33110 [Myxococcales bacterium]|nr:hypothetical protein [Myxococcales bacterium]
MAKRDPSDAGAPSAAVFCEMCPTWQIKQPERCSNTLEREGRTLYFCTRRCRERYERKEGSAR